LKDLEWAFQNIFAKRAGHPRICKRGVYASFRYPDPKPNNLDQGNARISPPRVRTALRHDQLSEDPAFIK
jgi:putative transposase